MAQEAQDQEPWMKEIDPDDTAAVRARNQSIFAMILWYATTNNIVTIEQADGQTQTTIKETDDSLTNHADQFGALATPEKFKAAAAWLQNYLATTDSMDSWYVKDPISRTTVAAKVNVGVAFRIVAQTFNAFSNSAVLNGGSGYDPQENCDAADIIAIVPQA